MIKCWLTPSENPRFALKLFATFWCELILFDRENSPPPTPQLMWSIIFPVSMRRWEQCVIWYTLWRSYVIAILFAWRVFSCSVVNHTTHHQYHGSCNLSKFVWIYFKVWFGKFSIFQKWPKLSCGLEKILHKLLYKF